LKKKQGKKKPGDPAKPGCKPVDFCFFLLKRHRFYYKKKTDPADPVKNRNPGLGPGWVLKLRYHVIIEVKDKLILIVEELFRT
jgi:hypothetical protein